VKRFSLSSRLVGHLLAGQLVVYLVILIINIPLALTGVSVDLDMKLDDFAATRARDQVAESLKFDANGVPFIRPTRRLRSHMTQNPSLKFAVYNLAQTFAAIGSSADLVAWLNRMNEVKALSMNFTINNTSEPNLRGTLTKQDTAVGRVVIAVYGYHFELSDLFYFFRDNARDNFIYFLPVAAAAALIAWLAARRGLAPVRRAAAYAAHINQGSIEQRIPIDNIPTEILPLFDAVNAALVRLVAGTERQRRFTTNAAHELRTPVAILHARIDALADVPSQNELKRDVRRIQTIIDQLLIAARLGSHLGSIDEAVDVAATVRAQVGDYAPLVIANNRDLEFVGPSMPVVVQGDRRALEGVVANLIDNALRAEPVGGTVVVRVAQDASVMVIDHGEGVAECDRAMIFEPFWRKSEAAPGSGLGLATVKELVDLHKGKIAVEETPGGGATFKMTLSLGC
jgi:two-component system, OmpR family, sensor kinase